MVEVVYKESKENTKITVSKSSLGKIYVVMERPENSIDNAIWIEIEIPKGVAKIIAETLNSEQD